MRINVHDTVNLQVHIIYEILFLNLAPVAQMIKHMYGVYTYMYYNDTNIIITFIVHVHLYSAMYMYSCTPHYTVHVLY